MSQHDFDLASGQSGSNFRTDVQNALRALLSDSSGATEPATMFAYQTWIDTTNGLVKQRNSANTAWIIRGTAAETRAVSKTSGYTVVDDDFGKLFKCTNTFSLALTAAATLADGFFFSVRNTGSGTITIDPNGSEQIDGATTIALAANEGCDIWCDGAAFYTVGRSISAGTVTQGQCRLTKSGSDLLLMPHNGNLLTVNGTACSVPDAGLTLAPTSLIADTTYYIYALATGGAVSSLEASTTAPQLSITTGNKGTPIKTGDDTRTLVGQARIVTGPAWSDTATKRFVLSYWNRRDIAAQGEFSTGRNTTSGTYAQLNSEIRCEFLTWADEAVDTQLHGIAYNSTAGAITYTGLGVDSATTATREVQYVQQAVIGTTGVSSLQHRASLTEGFHYMTLLGKVSGGTGNWYGGSTVAVMLRG
jgi:hypothetical protein